MPMFQVSEYGSCWFGTKEPVSCRARAGSVMGGTVAVKGRPPPARNPFWPKVGSVQKQLAVAPLWSPGVASQVCCNCGGSESKPRLSYRTSTAMPKPPRMEVSPDEPGDQANPTRGRK